MDKLRIKNFRSIKDSGMIELKPITVFLGKNSCGKSSFVRILPLIKQSLEKEKQEPLLWYGDYVDFGSFEEILPKNKTGLDFFELEFNIKIPKISTQYYLFYKSFLEAQFSGRNINLTITVEFQKKDIKSIKLSYLDQSVILHINNNSIMKCIINNNEDLNYSNYRLIHLGRGLLPKIIYHSQKNKSKFDFRDEYEEYDAIVELLKKQTGTRISKHNLCEFLQDISYTQTKESLLNKLQHCSKSKTIRKFFEQKKVYDEEISQINNQMQLILMPYVLHTINNYIETYFNNLYYIKPLRANANRYYRIQGVGVKSVESDGSNLPMILYNLSKQKQKEFSDWCKQQLGISFSVREVEGHISLMVKATDFDKNGINIADSGYGYSQMLPIILQMWLLINRNNKNLSRDLISGFTIVIEQPELHLHPAFQAKIMDMFVSLVEIEKKSGINVKIVLETHSDVMINRLGVLISKNKICEDDINIVLVEKTDGVSNFKQVKYNNEGLINAWPIGFMSPED